MKAEAPLPLDWPAQLLAFWFDAHGEGDWFGGGADFDAAVAKNFADWREQLRSLPADHFTADARTALAAVILFDQVPRNAHRGSAEAFATDHLALAIARAAIEAEFDEGLTPAQRLFLYLPFEHSEDIEDQRESVRLMATLDNPGWLEYAQAHLDMIKRFGRFPHRNALLGRADRPGEAEAVAAGNSW